MQFKLVFTVLNAAPAVADLEDDFYALSGIFCVNETEVIFLNFTFSIKPYKTFERKGGNAYRSSSD